MRPVHGACVFVVPLGSAADAILSEYTSLARGNLRAGAEVYSRLNEGKRRRALLMVEVGAITARSKASRYSDDGEGILDMTDDHLTRMSRLLEIQVSVERTPSPQRLTGQR